MRDIEGYWKISKDIERYWQILTDIDRFPRLLILNLTKSTYHITVPLKSQMFNVPSQWVNHCFIQFCFSFKGYLYMCKTIYSYVFLVCFMFHSTKFWKYLWSMLKNSDNRKIISTDLCNIMLDSAHWAGWIFQFWMYTISRKIIFFRQGVTIALQPAPYLFLPLQGTHWPVKPQFIT